MCNKLLSLPAKCRLQKFRRQLHMLVSILRWADKGKLIARVFTTWKFGWKAILWIFWFRNLMVSWNRMLGCIGGIHCANDWLVLLAVQLDIIWWLPLLCLPIDFLGNQELLIIDFLPFIRSRKFIWFFSKTSHVLKFPSSRSPSQFPFSKTGL